MNRVPDIKQFMLRTLWAADETPIPQSALTDACLNGMHPKPLVSDIENAREELEKDLYICGDEDPLTSTVNFTITGKGRNRAKQL